MMKPSAQSRTWSDIIFKLRHLLFWGVILLGLVTSFGIPSLYFSNDFRVYFSQENPQLKAFDSFEEKFSSHDSVAFILALENSSWLSPKYLQKLNQFTEQTWQLPATTRVNSLTNYQYTQAEGDLIQTDAFFRLGSDVDFLRQKMLDDIQLKFTYLSPDESVAVIQADLEFNKSDKSEVKEIYLAAQALQEQWNRTLLSAELPFKEIYIVGSVVSNVTLENAVKNDLILLVPLSYLIITFGLLFFLRSIKATLITLFIVTISIIFTFSIFSFFKQELTPVAGFVPSVILTLAVADCVHYLTSYRYLIEHENYSPEAANKEAYQINFSPISLTSVTTAIGVLFLNFSDSPPYRDLGNMVAIGVTLAWVLSISFIPIILTRFQINYPVRKSQSKGMLKFSRLLARNRVKVLFIMLSLSAISILGISQLRITENWSQYFGEEFRLSQAINLLKDKFNRLHRYEIVLDSQVNNGVNEPTYLNTLDQLIHYLERQSEVKHIQSYGYILKRLNQAMHQDSASYFKMPESRPLAAQYLLLYELSLPQGLGANAFVTFDRSATRTSILLEPMDSQQLLEFETSLHDAFATMTTGNNIRLEVSGMDNIFAHIAHRNIVQMIFGSATALLVISLLIAIVLRSFKYGMISLLPNLIPGAIAYGLWGYWFGYIDLALSVVICMSLGIIVDDSVHFITKYSRARDQLKQSSKESLNYAFHVVGKALVTTTVILVAGFATLVASPLNPTAATGSLLCITLVIALIVDFTLLPIALMLFQKDKTKAKV